SGQKPRAVAELLSATRRGFPQARLAKAPGKTRYVCSSPQSNPRPRSLACGTPRDPCGMKMWRLAATTCMILPSPIWRVGLSRGLYRTPCERLRLAGAYRTLAEDVPAWLHARCVQEVECMRTKAGGLQALGSRTPENSAARVSDA